MKTIGLALGSGGWRGIAHIGVIKCLLEHGFKISAIAGSSAGALIGGAYAATLDIQQLENIFTHLSASDLLAAFSDPGFGFGIFKGGRTQQTIEKYIGKHTLESLSLPFWAVATDLLTTHPVIIKTGDLAESILASSAFPGVFRPVDYGDHLLIDGGASLPVPVSVVKSMGVDIVIAVNVYAGSFPLPKDKVTPANIFSVTEQLLLTNLAKAELLSADVVVTPLLKDPTSTSFSHFIGNQDAVTAGYAAMSSQLDQLRPVTRI